MAKFLVLLFLTFSFSGRANLLYGPERDLVSFNESSTLRLTVWNVYKGDNSFYTREFLDLADQSDLMLMQEVLLHQDKKNLLERDHNRSWIMAEAWKQRGISTGSMITSLFRFLSPRALLSPDTEPMAKTPKSSAAFLLPTNGGRSVLVISTHALNFTGENPYKRQLDSILEMISGHKGPVIWAGDFNTWNSGRQKILQEKVTALGLRGIPFPGDPRFMILDHVFVRGFHVTEAQVRKDYESSDHWPLRVDLVMDSLSDWVGM